MTSKQKFAFGMFIIGAFAIGWNFGRESGLNDGREQVKAEVRKDLVPLIKECSDYLSICSEMLKDQPEVKPPQIKGLQSSEI